MKGKTLYECARWWRSQSFTHDIGGSFNEALYYEYLKCKSKCSDYNTTSTPSSSVNGCSTAEDSAGGSRNSSYFQGIVKWVALKLFGHDKGAVN